MPIKKSKKSNHRIFAIAFSTLIIISLLLMIPVAIMSSRTSTEQRSQAASNTNFIQVGIDQTERGQGNKKFRINSRRGIQEFIYFDGTYNLTENSLTQGEYQLDIQYNATEIVGRGLRIALVCVAQECQNLNGQGSVGMNQPLLNINPSSLGTGAKHIQADFTVGATPVRNTMVRLFADDGTNVEFDFVKLQKAGGNQILVNPSFLETNQINIERVNDGSTTSVDIYRSNQFLNTRYQSAFKSVIPSLYGKTNVLMFNGPEGNRDKVISTRTQYNFTTGRNYRLEMSYFMPKHSIQLDQDVFNLDIIQGNQVKRAVTSQLVQDECNYVTGADCQFSTLTQTFTPNATGAHEININLDVRAEVFIDFLRILELDAGGNPGRVVWAEEFNNVRPKQNLIVVPRAWQPREAWKQVYGMSYPW